MFWLFHPNSGNTYLTFVAVKSSRGAKSLWKNRLPNPPAQSEIIKNDQMLLAPEGNGSSKGREEKKNYRTLCWHLKNIFLSFRVS